MDTKTYFSHARPSRLYSFLFSLAVAVSLLAQGCSSTKGLPPAQSTNEFYQKYRNESGFKGTTLPVGLVTRFLSKDADTTVQAALANISSLRVLTFTPTNKRAQRLLDRGLTQELDQIFQQSSYVPLPVLQDAPESMQFKMRTNNDMVQEVVGYRKLGNSFFMMQINGRFTQRQIQELLRKIDPDTLVPLLG